MADVFTPAERSRVMRAVLSRDTQPELLVRRLAARLGFRTRAKSRTLPGSPDLVFTKLRKAIFVHGCFWHRHACPRGRSHPAERRAFWAEKFAGNVRRDRAALRALRRDGWQVLVIWECDLKQTRLERTIDRLRNFLNDELSVRAGSVKPARAERKRRESTRARRTTPDRAARKVRSKT